MKKTLFLVCVLCYTAMMYAGNTIMYVVGDNTAANYPLSSPERGWAQVLPTYLMPTVMMVNKAVDGASTKSFIDGGMWQAFLNQAPKRSILVLQFGLNDLKTNDPVYSASIEQMENNLLMMIKQARKRSMKVVLVTPIARIRYNSDSTFYASFGGYAQALRRVAISEHLPLIDLEAMTSAVVESADKEQVAAWYADEQNLTEEGALMVARLWAEEAQHLDVFKKMIMPGEPTEPIYASME